MNNNKKFVYEGRVFAYDSLVHRCWEASTYAPSEAKALANLKYRFRNEYNYPKNTPLDLPERIRIV